jgi:phosphatidylglycerol:prolipoprotein diacylglycerol transferase
LFPEIRLSSSLSLSTYFLLISIACIISSLWFIHRAEKRHLEKLTAIDFTLAVLISGFAGARLVHIVWEEPAYYMQNPLAALQVWNGGFVFLGGLMASWVCAVFYCQWKKEPFWFWADTAVPPISLGYALGRLACFANGCCFGRECELPWGIELHGAHRHPTQLYATFWELGLLGMVLFLEGRLKTSGMLFNLWLLGHAVGRVVMEAFRADPRGDFIHGLSLGMWMSFILAAFALFNLYGVLSERHHA